MKYDYDREQPTSIKAVVFLRYKILPIFAYRLLPNNEIEINSENSIVVAEATRAQDSNFQCQK
jgi:hypothetical protein